MARFIRNLVCVATLIAVLGSAGVASAAHINDSVKRHLQPNIGFWQHGNHHHAKTQSRPIMILGR